MNNKVWLIIEPYTHVEIKNNTIYLFNFLNKIEITIQCGNFAIENLMNSLKRKEYVIELDKSELEQEDMKRFINELRNSYSGDIIPFDLLPYKPLQIIDSVKIENSTLDSMDITKMQYSERLLLSSYLTDLHLYINSDQLANNLYDSAYKQFLVNFNSNHEYLELEFDVIERILNVERFYSSNLRQINILGGNIFKYSRINKLLELVKSSNLSLNFYFRDIDFISTDNTKIVYCLKKINAFSHCKIFVTFPLMKGLITDILNYIKTYKINVELYFIVESEANFIELESIIENKVIDYKIMPFYNGNNNDFFQESVFILKEEILNQNLNSIEAQVRQQVNPLFFGQILILSNGNIHDNINLPHIGNINNVSIHEVIYNLLQNDKNAWKLVRNNVQPCCNCIYSSLCTPISNYELAIKRYNLCRIFEDSNFNKSFVKETYP